MDLGSTRIQPAFVQLGLGGWLYVLGCLFVCIPIRFPLLLCSSMRLWWCAECYGVGVSVCRYGITCVLFSFEVLPCFANFHLQVFLGRAFDPGIDRLEEADPHFMLRVGVSMMYGVVVFLCVGGEDVGGGV